MVNFRYNGEPFDGIFNFLKKKSRGVDIFNAGLISVKTSTNTTNPAGCDVKLPFGYNNENYDKYWYSDDLQDQFYQIHFNLNHVVLNSYVYRVNVFDFFEKWNISGSNDETNWVLLDSNENTTYPSIGYIKSKHFVCSEKVKKPFSYFRIQVHGKRNWKTNNFVIYGLEFFGKICSYEACTTRCKRTFTISLIFVFIMYKQ